MKTNYFQMFPIFMMVGIGVIPLCNTSENYTWDNRPFYGKWPNHQGDARDTKNEANRTVKKQKRSRTAFTTYQVLTLEKAYLKHNYVDGIRCTKLAKFLNIEEKSVKLWFKNRRAKEKRKTFEDSSNISETNNHQSPPIDAEIVDSNEYSNTVPITNYWETCDPTAIYQYQSLFSDKNQRSSKPETVICQSLSLTRDNVNQLGGFNNEPNTNYRLQIYEPKQCNSRVSSESESNLKVEIISCQSSPSLEDSGNAKEYCNKVLTCNYSETYEPGPSQFSSCIKKIENVSEEEIVSCQSPTLS